MPEMTSYELPSNKQSSNTISPSNELFLCEHEKAADLIMKNEKLYKELKQLIDTYKCLNTIREVAFDLFNTFELDFNYNEYENIFNEVYESMTKTARKYRKILYDSLKDKYIKLVPNDNRIILTYDFLDKIIKEL